MNLISGKKRVMDRFPTYFAKPIGENEIQRAYRNVDVRLDRKRGLRNLNELLERLKMPTYDEEFEMYSEHLIIFAEIAELVRDVNTVLEIGTHVGTTTKILSALFPKANITTFELPSDDIRFTKKYNFYTKDISSFKSKQQSNLCINRINFVEESSSSLI